MKQVVIKRTRKDYITLALRRNIYFIIFGIVLIALGITNVINSKNAFTTISGEISEVVQDSENSDKYSYHFVDNEKTYILVKPEVEINVGDTVVFTILPTQSDNINVFKVFINPNNYNDTTDSYISTIIKIAIGMFVIGGLLLLYVVVMIILSFKKPLEIKKDYIEMMLQNKNIMSNQMFDSSFYVSKTVRIFNVMKYSLYILILIVLVLILFSLARDVDPIMIGIYGIIIGLLLIATMFIHPYFYSKDAKRFTEDYLKYLNEGSKSIYYESPFNFRKEGLKYTKDNKVSFYDYHELNLYLVGLYSKGNYACNLFVCSDMKEVEEDELGQLHDFIIPLTHTNYQEIKENGIFVKNLDEVINKLEEEIVYQNKQKGPKYKVVKYNE